METELTQKNGAWVLSVEGDVDLYSAPALHRSWLDHAQRPGSGPLVLDLTGASYLDSSGIGVLMQILADSRDKKIPFRLCGVHGMIGKLLRLSRMDSVLPISGSLEDALKNLKP